MKIEYRADLDEKIESRGVRWNEHGPVEIAGALEEFIDALRTGRNPAGHVRTNILSLAMVEAAVTSSELGRRITIDTVLNRGYENAVANENDPAVRETLEGWGSFTA